MALLRPPRVLQACIPDAVQSPQRSTDVVICTATPEEGLETSPLTGPCSQDWPPFVVTCSFSGPLVWQD